jgi:acyl-CoA dehydrogenase
MSDTQDLIIQTAGKLFEDHCTPETLRLAEQGHWPGTLWELVEQTGLNRVSLPEKVEGAGGDLSDALAVLRITGRFAVPLPLAETYLAGWLLAASGRALPTGPHTVAFSQSGTEVCFHRRASRWVLSGTVSHVGWARHAQQILVLGRADDRLFLTLVKPEQVTISPAQNLAGEPRDMLTFTDVEVAEVIPAAVTLDWAWNRAALTRAALMTGALEGILRLSVHYTGERVQFGHPLNHFQAVQQQLALLAGEVAAARVAVEATALAAEQGEATAAVAASKIRVGEAAGQAAAIAHQVHGAMGYTHEYPLHFLTKRLWAWRDEFGSESQWAERLGYQIATQGAGALWPFLTT